MDVKCFTVPDTQLELNEEELLFFSDNYYYLVIMYNYVFIIIYPSLNEDSIMSMMSGIALACGAEKMAETYTWH